MTTQKPDLGELLRRVPDWSEAACRDADPEIFFPDPGRPAHAGPTQVALACCARCPIRQECLDYALTTKQQYGIWGGKTEEQRKRLRVGARADAPVVARRWAERTTAPFDPAEQEARTERRAGNVTQVGLTRRLRALHALGWTASAVGRHVDVAKGTILDHLNGEADAPLQRTELAILTAYRRLSKRYPTAEEVTPSHAGRSRRRATRMGWAPPGAWEGVSIDDPEATPVGGPSEWEVLA